MKLFSTFWLNMASYEKKMRKTTTTEKKRKNHSLHVKFSLCTCSGQQTFPRYKSSNSMCNNTIGRNRWYVNKSRRQNFYQFWFRIRLRFWWFNCSRSRIETPVKPGKQSLEADISAASPSSPATTISTCALSVIKATSRLDPLCSYMKLAKHMYM